MISKKLTAFLPIVWGFFLWLLIVPFQAKGIYGGDSGDLVTAAWLGGVPHPPGYPFYTFLGHLVRWIPIFSPVWRVGLLSSLPHAAAASLVMLFVWQVTGAISPGIFASLVLVGNYLFFLYSVTPEVFALLDFFIITLFYLCYRWVTTKKTRYLYSLSFVTGLSLTHHPVILFLFPVLGYWLWTAGRIREVFIRCFGLFLLGFLPVIYIPIAARGTSIINWDRAGDLTHFVRLVTRADYGVFVSGGFYGSQLTDRLIQLKLYFQFVLFDMRWAGIILGVAGWYWFWRRNRLLALGLLAAFICVGPLFFFYASFPLVNRFTIGTYERFLLPSYLLGAIFMGLGIGAVMDVLKRFFRTGFVATAAFRALVLAIFFLYPVATYGVTVWRFWGFSGDATAENLGRDILASVPKNGILLLERDTPLFTTQYVRYVLGEGASVKLIQSSLLSSDWYPPLILGTYRNVSIPSVRGTNFATEFVGQNSGLFPITSITRLPVPAGWVWVPHGLVFILEPLAHAETADAMLVTNQSLWSSYHTPTTGILSRYNHLMLADVRDVYMSGHLELGKTLVKAQKFMDAKTEFERAIELGGDTQLGASYVYLGLTEIILKECSNALSSFGKARETSALKGPDISLYEALTYRDCIGNSERATQLFDEFQRQQEKKETPLELP